ncbi:MAG: IPT/TIG domain-containing protein [Bacteroidota bacterium]|nr:IPT/TIG domain-containing protein [Cytophagales bacterium]
MKQIARATLILLAILGSNTATSQVTISSFTPDRGAVGTIVTINGSSFSPIPSENTVTFGGVMATVVSSSSSVITAKVPSGAVYGKLSVEVRCKKAVSSSNFIPLIELTGTISTNTLLISNLQYLLKGTVYVESGVTLTIQPGTTIFGDKSSFSSMLIIMPGGKIEANGTEQEPIVFTSSAPAGFRNPGEWGGVHILGNAFVNQLSRPYFEGQPPFNQFPQFGTTVEEGSDPTTNASESSGTIRYVRIEYAGKEVAPNQPTNGLTLAGVGSGTTVEYVQVSQCKDDGFQFSGGTVNAKYLISFSNLDDDFDSDLGWGGNVQFAVAIRNPTIASENGSNGIESDNQGNSDQIAGVCDGGNNSGCTRGIFSNVSVFGPREVQGRFISSNYRNSIHFRRRSSISVFNSFFAGFRLGFRVDDQPSLDNLTTFSSSKFSNNVLLVPGTVLIGTNTSPADAGFATNLFDGNATSISNYWSTNNSVINNIADNQVYNSLGINPALFWGSQITYHLNPDFVLTLGVAGSNNLNSGSDFSDSRLTNAFFTQTTYRGAFGAVNDWTDNWSNFNPQSTNYQPKSAVKTEVVSFSPSYASSGSDVLINGSNFTSATSVSFGGVPASSFEVLSESTITAKVGLGASGDVSVTTSLGTARLCGFSYVKLPQSIILNSLPPKTFGDPPFKIEATSSSGLPVDFVSSDPSTASIAGNTVTILKAGTVNITASQSGDSNFSAASNVVQLLSIDKADQNITFPEIADKTLGDAPSSFIPPTSTSGLRVMVTPNAKIIINGNQINPASAGKASITASQSGNENYKAASAVIREFCIKPTKPSVSVLLASGNATLTSDASSGNQWFVNGAIISGANNKTYIATAAGAYKVQVTIENCLSEFSNDVPVVITGDLSGGTVSAIQAYPNPASNLLLISGLAKETNKCLVVDVLGRAVEMPLENVGEQHQLKLEGLNEGMYIIRVKQNNSIEQVRLVKNN